MYGTIYRFRPKAGQEAEALAMLQAEGEEERARLFAAGMVTAYVYQLDTGGYMGAVAFENKEKYFANANDPAQDVWYRKFRSYLDEDPEWNDGEIILAVS